MGNKYIYPTEKLNIQLNLEVDVKFIGVWSGVGSEFLHNKYQEMLEDGSFINLIKETILSKLTGETFIAVTQNLLIDWVLILQKINQEINNETSTTNDSTKPVIQVKGDLQ